MKDATPRRRKLGSMKDVSAAQDGTKWQLRLSKGVRRDGTRRTWSKTIEGTQGEAEALLARTALRARAVERGLCRRRNAHAKHNVAFVLAHDAEL